MKTKFTNRVHWSFWLTSTFMLIWCVMGCVNFIMQLNPETLSFYRETERLVIQDRPVWATIGFAVSVFLGALGCIFLLLRRYFSIYLFILSLVGTIVAIVHSMTLNISFAVGEIIGIILLPVLVPLFLIAYVIFIAKKGWFETYMINVGVEDE